MTAALLTPRELEVLELRVAGMRTGAIATRLCLARQSVARCERAARAKLFGMYKEALMDGKLTDDEFSEVAQQKDEPGLVKRATMDAVASERPTDDDPDRMRDWKIRMIAFDFPRTAKFLETLPVDTECEPLDDAIDELYAKASPFDGATKQDIDETLGEGFGDFVENEQQMPGGGVFSAGGISGGGIFGTNAVATAFTDPEAHVRQARVKRENATAELDSAKATKLLADVADKGTKS